MGDARDRDLAALHHLGDVMGRGLAFHGGVGGQDHFADLATVEQGGELIEPDRLGADPVQRRQMAHQHEEQATVVGSL